MAIDNKMIVVVVACVVVAAAGVTAFYLLNYGKDESYSITIEEGQTITDAQLEDIKNHAKSSKNTTLVYNNSGYKVVFDSEAILHIDTIADLTLEDVNPDTLPDEVKNELVTDAKVININYGENSNFGSGKVLVTIPYAVPDGKKASDAAGFYVSSGGQLEGVPVSISDGKATLAVSHFSNYSIAYPTENHTVKVAELKVYGNLNGDTAITSADVDALNALIAKGMPGKLYPLADANNDGVLDSNDVTVLNNIIAGTKTTIWHINYHDVNGDGIMDEELVSTVFPVTSTIMTGSANNFMMLYMLGIIDEVKGACYGAGNDAVLFGDSYLNENKVVKLNSVSTTIPFEDGRAGASDVVRKESVTCLVTDWNRTYIENESAFEAGKVDVVRIAAASSDKESYTHTIALLGLLFQKKDAADDLLQLYDDTFDTIADATKDLDEAAKKKVVASSMTSYVSSKDSDYTAFCEKAGGVFGLEGFDFNGSTSAYVPNSLGIFKYKFDNIVHIRTALTYASTETEIAEQWANNANAMKMWEHVYDGQVIVSGSIPVPVRVAYIAYALYGDSIPAINKAWADGIHADFANLYAKTDVPLDKTFVLTGYEFPVVFDNEVVKVTKAGVEISNGTKVAYGTDIVVTLREGKELEGYLIVVNGEVIDSGATIPVLDTMNIKYANYAPILAELETMASNFVLKNNGLFHSQNVIVDDSKAGQLKITNVSYSGSSSSKLFTPRFAYYESADDAKAKYEEYKALIIDKHTGADKQTIDCSAFETDGSVDGMCLIISTSRKDTTDDSKKYIGSTAYCVAYKGNYVFICSNIGSSTPAGYIGAYGYDTTLWTESAEDQTKLKAYFKTEAEKFVAGLAYAFSPTP